MRTLFVSSILVAALLAIGCNPADPYCDPATPCIGDNEICNYAFKRCEQKPDAGVEAGVEAGADGAPDAGGAADTGGEMGAG